MRKIRHGTVIITVAWAVVLMPSSGWSDEPVVPPSYSLSRYKLLFERFPFGREAQSQPAPPPPAGPGLSDKWQLTGHFMIGSVIYVNVLNRQSQERQTFSSDEKDPQRLKVVSLKDDPDPYSVKVVVQAGAETGTLSFDRPQAPRMPMPNQQLGQQMPGQMANRPVNFQPGAMGGISPSNVPASLQQRRNPGVPPR